MWSDASYRTAPTPACARRYVAFNPAIPAPTTATFTLGMAARAGDAYSAGIVAPAAARKRRRSIAGARGPARRLFSRRALA
jgi:hypothetical protein